MKYKFTEDFKWGASSSGVQSEGITNKANPSIWEYWFEKEPERFYHQLSNFVACDTYNRYQEDVKLMQDINLNSFRTSIQWSRLIKNFETGEICEDGYRFYRNYFQAIKDAGIHLVINLYHFDMPQELELTYGGFVSKKVVDMYVDYAKKCFDLFDDVVDMWATFNEPIVPVECGYFYGYHYPAIHNPQMGIQVGFNTLLAHAKVVQAYHQGDYQNEIGVILNITPVYPASQKDEDIQAATECDAIFNRSFIDPMVKGEFNQLFNQILKDNDLIPDKTEAEEQIILNNPVDFVGLNYYVPRRAKAPEKRKTELWLPEWHYEPYVDPNGRFNPHRDNNEIVPSAVYDIAKDIQNNYGNIKWYLAEIGISMTNEDQLREENGEVDDTFRTELFKEHMIELHKAIMEGSNCFGVHQWTFIDNWSWLNSHKRRYGFYYLDLDTRERYLKKHGKWFAKLIINNGF